MSRRAQIAALAFVSQEKETTMRRTTLCLALSITASAALAQEAKTPPEGTEKLPKACQAATEGGGMMGKAMEMGGMAAQSMSDMSEAQMASMKAMMVMHKTMNATQQIKDPDLSFVCGMIAHHRGAIAMSKSELQSGKDEQARAFAKKIIEDQEREIAEFEAWATKKGN